MAVGNCLLIGDGSVISLTSILSSGIKVTHPNMSNDLVNEIRYTSVIKVSLITAYNCVGVSQLYGFENNTYDNMVVFDPGGEPAVPLCCSPSSKHVSLPIQTEPIWETVVLKLKNKGDTQLKTLCETAGVVYGPSLLLCYVLVILQGFEAYVGFLLVITTVICFGNDKQELALDFGDTRDVYLTIVHLIMHHNVVDGALKHPWNELPPSSPVDNVINVHDNIEEFIFQNQWLTQGNTTMATNFGISFATIVKNHTETFVACKVLDSNLEDKVLIGDWALL